MAATGGGPVAVVGPSGSGKSSLLRAGLIPAAESGALSGPGPATWPVVLVTPGEAPLRRLATALSPQAGLPASAIGDRLRADPASLAGLLDAILAARATPDAGPARVVLIVDQFEEVFALCPDEGERSAFIAALAAAGPVVFALRADCYGHCLAYPALVPALRDRQVLIGPMTEAELRDVIGKPARAAGLALQPGLTDLLLRDISGGRTPGEDEAALPLLGYALLATWQRREGRALTMAGYQAGGGIWGAVAQAAERQYQQLDPPGRDAAG